MERVLVVLGSADERERLDRAEAAARCTQVMPGVRVVVFCGYNGESVAMEAHARACGMRSDLRVLLEHHSRHTRENGLHAQAVLRHADVDPEQVFIAVLTSRYHVPRAWMSFRAIFPHVGVVLHGRLCFDDVRRFLRRELPKIVRYSRQGDLYPFNRQGA